MGFLGLLGFEIRCFALSLGFRISICQLRSYSYDLVWHHVLVTMVRGLVCVCVCVCVFVRCVFANQGAYTISTGFWGK